MLNPLGSSGSSISVVTKLQAESLALNSSRERDFPFVCFFFLLIQIKYYMVPQMKCVFMSCYQNEGHSQYVDMANKFFENVVEFKRMGKLHARIN